MRVRLVQPSASDYPVGLLDLEDPPPIYVQGDLVDQTGVAVVGTRRCTRYGIDLAESFGAMAARSGWTTVSGLARGIDAAAHRGCLRAMGHAVAILGSGIDVCYPKENLGIYQGILDLGGAVISEYPPGTPPDRWRFPARNRLIAALSAAVVVVEAAEKGGALITARLAAEAGRAVLAVPGDVDREASAGSNRLIRDGAIPVFGADDLREELSLLIGPPAASGGVAETGLPAEGARIDLLPEIWSVTAADALVRLGRLEVSGLVKRDGDTVRPT